MEEKELTFGQRLIGITFNPSGDEKAQKAKELCAELADLLRDNLNLSPGGNSIKLELYKHAVGQILNAQMNVVKVLTFKE